ncbi:sirohydrochlorin chelatase [Sinomonas susongensis]|uniref:sirohydrochlorin chelatase n=1 Tax=Sinomonas susongensis TaxID=1324851 RepID=UPI0011098EC4|nr:CbiX/SirB N-terminal domain-containing protein [Sinomonas susongensis]
MTQPFLVACAHGTSNPDGKAAILGVVDELRAARPDVTVLEAYVDVHGPELPRVVEGLPADVPAVVVPLLLSVGYHVKVDIGRAVKSRERTTAAAPLGPDARLAEVLRERLAAAALGPDDAVVLAAAGSSNPAAADDVERLADMLRHLIPNRVLPAYGASAEPSVPDAVAELRAEETGRIVIASYLLAPGYFHDQLARAGADAVATPLLPSPEVARIALDRFDAALATL